MRYAKKTVKAPPDLKVGAEIGIIGEANDVFVIAEIRHRADGVISDVVIKNWSREPLSHIYLLRGRSHEAAWSDKTSWIKVAIGECDICKSQFPDSCVYESDPKIPNSMICQKCWKKTKSRSIIV
jgi:hypothetical protein